MSISTEIDKLITSMLISNRLDASFPVNMVEMPKLHCRAAGHTQQAKKVQAGRRPTRGAAGQKLRLFARTARKNVRKIGKIQKTLQTLYLRFLTSSLSLVSSVGKAMDS